MIPYSFSGFVWFTENTTGGTFEEYDPLLQQSLRRVY